MSNQESQVCLWEPETWPPGYGREVVRRIIVGSLFSAAVGLFTVYFYRLGDTTSAAPSWWNWLVIAGGVSVVIGLAVAMPPSTWRLTWRLVSRVKPIAAWHSFLAWRRKVDQRLSRLEETVAPMGTSADQVKVWRQGIDDEVQRLENEVSRLELNLSSVQGTKSALEKFEKWLAEREETPST